MRKKQEKRWIVPQTNLDQATQLSDALNLSIPVCLLLLNRGLTTADAARKFLYPQWEDLHDPFRFNDMQKAVDRIKQAIDQKEKICIYGDYDTDGTTSISILIHTFRYLGVEVDFYLPNRFKDGYGVNKTAIRTIAQRRTDLLITVDCGITSISEVKLANKLGIDVIITDHHLPKEGNFPPACALITPRLNENQYPYMELAGVGLAFKLASALVPDKKYLESLLDLVTLGTVVDVAPLTGENRVITKLGLDILNDPDIPKRAGIKALCSVAGYSQNQILNGYSFGFGLGPRINAAGRMGSADKVIKLFTTDDYNEALTIAMDLDQLNQNRKDLEAQIKEDAISIIRKERLQDHEGIVVAGDWGKKAKGVIGIVAARILEEFHKPTILLTESDGEISGSGRCIEGLNLSNALTSCSKHLLRYGGHAVAAGLSMKKENLDAFRKDFCQYIRDNLTEDYLTPQVTVDHKLDLSLINLEYLNELSILEPFGNKNFKPKLIATGVKLKELPIPIGKTREHLSLNFQKGNTSVRGLYWRGSPYIRIFENLENEFDIIFTPEINEFNNKRRVQIIIEDWKSKKKSKIKKQRIFPKTGEKDTNLLFKVIDSRGKDKISYLKTIFNRKEPSIIYVRDWDSIDYLLKTFRKEFPDLLKVYNPNGKKKSDLNKDETIITNISLPIQKEYPFIKHHIFCHPVTAWEEFYKRCRPAISTEYTCGIHLLYSPIDQHSIRSFFRNRYRSATNNSKDKFLFTNLENFLDFQYQEDIEPIWDRIQLEFEKGEK